MSMSLNSILRNNLATKVSSNKSKALNWFNQNVQHRSSSVRSSIETDRWVKLKNGNDSLEICRVLNGMWQTSGGWGEINQNSVVEAMIRYADAGFTTFDMADIYGPAEDLYGIFINKVRREHPHEYLEKIKGLTKWVPPPVKITSSYVRASIEKSRKRMDVASLDMLQLHWWDYENDGYLDAIKHLNDLKEEDKIKTLALTNFDTERLEKMRMASQLLAIKHASSKENVQLCKLKGVKLIIYGTVMGGILSEEYLNTNLQGTLTPSLQLYKRTVDAWGWWDMFQGLLRTLKNIATKHGVSIPTVTPGVAGSMIGVKLGLSEHIKDANAIFSLVLDEEYINSIEEVTKKGKNLLQMIGDCGDEYRGK